jgi:hypothetical protein
MTDLMIRTANLPAVARTPPVRLVPVHTAWPALAVVLLQLALLVFVLVVFA